MVEKVIRVPTNIPLIGQGPTPEQIRTAQDEMLAVFKTWPVAAYPQGPNVPPYWGGETVLHKFTYIAMESMKEQFGAKSRTPEELIKLCQRAWQIAIFMMKTSPLYPQVGPNAPEKPATDPGADPSPEPDASGR